MLKEGELGGGNGNAGVSKLWGPQECISKGVEFSWLVYDIGIIFSKEFNGSRLAWVQMGLGWDCG